MTAQIQFPAAPLGGSFTATVQDNNGAPVTVLEASAPIRVRLDWTLNAVTAPILGGQWRVSGYFESMGGGPLTAA